MDPTSAGASTPQPFRRDRPSRDPGLIPNYDLLEFIKAGGFGDVWLARERVTSARRVVKVVYKADAARAARDIQGVQRYQLCAHNHPHLIQILTVGETERCFYYVMEAADNARPKPGDVGDPAVAETYTPTSLRTLMRATGRFEARAALVLVQRLAAGVARLHEQDLAHYDLKPENILIVEGEPKISDVGLVAPLKAAAADFGTPLYMTPQGAADDLYALGRILYELVSGRPSGDFPRLPPELVRAPDALASAAVAIINRACHPDGAKRFGCITELTAALDYALRPVRAVDRLWRARSTRGKGIIVGTAAAAVLLALVLAMHVYRGIVPVRMSWQTIDLSEFREPLEVEKAQLGNTPMYPYLAVGGRLLPQAGRYLVKLPRPAENFVLDARLRFLRPWGSLELGVAASPEERGAVHVVLRGQPDGLGLYTQLDRTASTDAVREQSADILGHPQPGIEYIIRLARCRDGAVLVLWPAAAATGPVVQHVALPERGLVARYATIRCSSADPRAAVELSDLRVATYTAPLRDALRDAPVPEWVTGIVAPAFLPRPRDAAAPPGGNLLVAPYHPYDSDAWMSIGNWSWWEAAAPAQTPKAVRCTPFSTHRRQALRGDIYSGLQMLRFDRAAFTDFQADVRIKLADWDDPTNRQDFDPFVSESSAGAVGLALLSDDAPPAGWAWGPGLMFALDLEPNGSHAPSASIAHADGFSPCWQARERCAWVSAFGAYNLQVARNVCARTELLAPSGFLLSVRRQGTRLELRLNGRPEPIVVADDPAPFGDGRIALYASRLIATFEALEVRRLPAEGGDPAPGEPVGAPSR